MTPSLVYVLKRQERMGRLKVRRFASVQQVLDELAKLGVDPSRARERLLDLDGVESFRSPYYGLITVEYPVEWTLPPRMRNNGPSAVPVGYTYRDYMVVRSSPMFTLVMRPLKGDGVEYVKMPPTLDEFHAAVNEELAFRKNSRRSR